MNNARRSAAGAAMTVSVALVLTACGSTGGGDDTASPAADGERRIVNVVKLAGGDWFNRMAVGNDEYAAEHEVTVSQTAGDDSSEEKQIAVLNDLIPQRPAALTVVPNSPESLEAVLGRAQDAGIVVITHEAPGIQNAEANIEAFVNADYGAHQMDLLAECMDGEGSYAHFVGSLTVASHNVWADGALAQAEAEYPGVTRVADAISSEEDQEVAYQRTKELLATYPDIRGFIGAASTDVAGIGRAIEEAGREADTCVVGTSTPAIVGNQLESGSVDVITGWDPALAGQAMLAAAEVVLDGGELTEGTDLGVPGYESLRQDPEVPNSFFGDAWIDITNDNQADYPF
ncbi:monosaccharide ABC transporter substrate-binding protein, CUT2 family [Georgenia satyanarayanai]|uniref:Monosaccharide ABC transporter substrate-binding protein, CUT2 family n=2 Tax=Georgenia TaxID=154116 RepID=A0A2Y9ABC3_9MICO|nr:MULTISPECIES: substrate-binding domain-containing protein [Georgenia]MBD8063527.1 substrate-binding domain-containing protein [Oceanitalea stevensii]PYG00458.1 monosaccharide ABC transporter substrate-binding protein (CUT2 family) [Georgenia satyanarayanai]SSA39839.1 monosaccharide ABC transporter substrate-binding protein, CUT2 family [Georgenia satyanarayanai]